MSEPTLERTEALLNAMRNSQHGRDIAGVYYMKADADALESVLAELVRLRAELPNHPDARLIAAAPDLLEACKRLVAENVDTPRAALVQAEAAIAKAVGSVDEAREFEKAVQNACNHDGGWTPEELDALNAAKLESGRTAETARLAREYGVTP